jgi:hypothetical protein
LLRMMFGAAKAYARSSHAVETFVRTHLGAGDRVIKWMWHLVTREPRSG